MLIDRIFSESIIALSISSHHLHLPNFITKRHVTNLSSFKALNLSISFLNSILTFGLFL